MDKLRSLCSEASRQFHYTPDPEGKDVWKSPGMLKEVLGLGTDCEDASLLLLDMVRGEIPELRRFLVIGDSPGGRHAWCHFVVDDGQAWWADPTFGGGGRVAQALWDGYVPLWGCLHDSEGKLRDRFKWRKLENK